MSKILLIYYSHWLNFRINHVLINWVNRQYANKMAMSHKKNANGNGCNLKAPAIGVNGSTMPISMMREVSAITGAAAQL